TPAAARLPTRLNGLVIRWPLLPLWFWWCVRLRYWHAARPRYFVSLSDLLRVGCREPNKLCQQRIQARCLTYHLNCQGAQLRIIHICWRCIFVCEAQGVAQRIVRQHACSVSILSILRAVGALR